MPSEGIIAISGGNGALGLVPCLKSFMASDAAGKATLLYDASVIFWERNPETKNKKFRDFEMVYIYIMYIEIVKTRSNR